jgi:2-polyprenyl-3-methyl-5-hydroxy-6-metoxy-1,4-benzoquinol methylase
MDVPVNMPRARTCWCGDTELLPFSPTYLRCAACGTLVVAEIPASNLSRVSDDEHDFYGREYWFSHQKHDLGFPDVTVRARNDIPERCVHWLKALLKFKRPPAQTLELGCAHGGFVALMQWAGFTARGLELSPWIADFASRTFGISMLVGPVEEQSIASGSLDVIALMDVLEHLTDPAGTMAHCLRLLKPDGMLLIQTPRFDEAASYDELTARRDPFLEQLKHEQHLFLFSERSIRELFQRLGAGYLQFEPAMFAHYDMFLAVSRAPLVELPTGDGAVALEQSPSSRLVQALLDLDHQSQQLKQQLATAEADRAARLDVMHRQGAELARIPRLEAELAALEADRAARLDIIHTQGAELARIPGLEADLAAIEADRAARLEVIHQQGAEINRLRAELAAVRRPRTPLDA